MSKKLTEFYAAWSPQELAIIESLITKRVSLSEAAELLAPRSRRAVQLMAQKLRKKFSPKEPALQPESESTEQRNQRRDAEIGCASLLKALLRFYSNRKKALARPIEVPVLEDGTPDYRRALESYNLIERSQTLSKEQTKHKTSLENGLRRQAERAHKERERAERKLRDERARRALARAATLESRQREQAVRDSEEFAELRPDLLARMTRGEIVTERVVGCRKLYQEIIEFYEQFAADQELTSGQMVYLETVRLKRHRQQISDLYRKRHPERVVEANRANTKKNPDVMRRASEKYRKTHREKTLQQMKDYRRRNAEKCRKYKAVYHEKKHSAQCVGCGKNFEASQHTLDHAPPMGVFCSKKCRFNHPEYRVEKTAVCEQCGKSFQQRILPWNEPSPTCSKKCRSRRSVALRKNKPYSDADNGLSPPESVDTEGLSSSCCEPEAGLRDRYETSRESTLELSD